MASGIPSPALASELECLEPALSRTAVVPPLAFATLVLQLLTVNGTPLATVPTNSPEGLRQYPA
jgi:hypothetical protein